MLLSIFAYVSYVAIDICPALALFLRLSFVVLFMRSLPKFCDT